MNTAQEDEVMRRQTQIKKEIEKLRARLHEIVGDDEDKFDLQSAVEVSNRINELVVKYHTLADDRTRTRD